MKTYAFDFINQTPILVYANRKDASNAGNGKTLVSTEEELGKIQMPTGAFLELYNAHMEPGNKVTRFSDRPSAVKRVFALAVAKAIEVPESTQETDMAKKGPPKSAEEKTAAAQALAEKKVADKAAKLAAKPVKEPKAVKAEGEKTRGRKSQFIGKLIVATDALKAKTWREGSSRAKSFGLMVGAGDAGISYADYLAQGGAALELGLAVLTKNQYAVLRDDPNYVAPVVETQAAA